MRGGHLGVLLYVAWCLVAGAFGAWVVTTLPLLAGVPLALFLLVAWSIQWGVVRRMISPPRRW